MNHYTAMRRKTIKLFSAKRLRTPSIWHRPSVLVASLGINVLALALPIVILQVYDRIIPSQAEGTFLILILGMVAVVTLDTAFRIFRSAILSWEGARFDHRESLKVMNRILDAKTMAFNDKPTGFYLDRMQSLEKIQEFYSGQSILLMIDLPFVLLFMGLIWVITGPMLLIPTAMLSIFVLLSVISGRKLQEALETRSLMEDRRQNFIIETLQGIHTVKSMAMEAFMMRRYERLQSQSASSVCELSRINSLVQGMGAAISQLAVVGFVGIGAMYVIDGSLSMGALAAGTMLSGRVLQPGLRAMGFWTQFQSLKLATNKVNELFQLPPESTGNIKHEKGVAGSISLRNVHFCYPEMEHTLINGISIEIAPGEAIGITGNNGAGKSTLINLLSGFLSPDEGEVLIDGRKIDAYNLEFLRTEVGILPQRGILFEGTILENMTLYREGEAIEQAIELAQVLGLGEIIARLPKGLDTQVGGAAVDTLSEGVRQKIIIVRALVGNPHIILFDDANANFDIKNDAKLLKLIKRYKGKRTLVIVSHRPSFLRLCDRQFLLQDGELRPRVDTFAASAPKSAISKGVA